MQINGSLAGVGKSRWGDHKKMNFLVDVRLRVHLQLQKYHLVFVEDDLADEGAVVLLLDVGDQQVEGARALNSTSKDTSKAIFKDTDVKSADQ